VNPTGGEKPATEGNVAATCGKQKGKGKAARAVVVSRRCRFQIVQVM